MINYFVSLISAIIFSFIDSSFFLIGEQTIQSKIESLKYIDTNLSELITGGISNCIAIYIASYFRHFINKRFETIETPIIDVIGIITGTLIVIGIYLLLKLLKNKIKSY